MSDSIEFADISILPRSLGLASDEAEVERRELLLMRSNDRLLGLFADEAASVTKWREPTPLPRAAPAVLGVIAVRGRISTVLDPLMLLGEREDKSGVSYEFIVTLRGEEQLALAVERVEGIIEISTDEIEPLGTAGGATLRGVVQRESGLVAVLNLQELFPAALRGTERRRRRN